MRRPGNQDSTFSFDATGTTDSTETSLTYEWDLGNGETISGTSTVSSYSYNSIGEYTVAVTVTNGYGNTDTATVPITVESRDPTASLSTDQEIGDTDTSFGFSASGSTDPDGTTLTYEWGFGDGNSATGKTASHSFTDPGDYTVNLLVTDKYGNTDSTATTITVNAQSPTATFTVSPENGDTETAFGFDGTDSADPDGTSLSFSWTFGDGATATGAQPTHSFSEAGTYNVELTVEDAYGMTSTDSTSIAVESATLDGTIEDFESGTVDAWKVNNFKADTAYSWSGSWSGLATYNSGTNSDLSGDNPQAYLELDSTVESGQITISYHYYESTNGNGHSFGLEDINGTPICAVGSDNPEWLVFDNSGWTTVSSASNENRWTHIKITVDFDSGSFSWQFSDEYGNSKSGSGDVRNNVPLERLALRPNSSRRYAYVDDPTYNNNIEVWIDDIQATQS
jgi:PKD repeat protein